MVSIIHKWFLLSEDIKGFLEETDSDVGFSNSDSEARCVSNSSVSEQEDINENT